MGIKKYIAIGIAFALLLTANISWAGFIDIQGSTTVEPIALKVAEVYMEQNPDIKINITGTGSGDGIKAIIDNTTDIANSSRFIKDKEVKDAVSKGVYPVPFMVAYDCIVPIVHPDNPVENLTLDQLKSIYSGEITNWKELGGKNKEILIISRDRNSGTYEVWKEKVMRNERMTKDRINLNHNAAIVDRVSQNEKAIGYIGLGYLTKKTKQITVDGIKGSEETTINGTYPISRPLYMFTNGWPKLDTLNFIKFVLHPEKGQKYVKEVGYVPLY